MFQYSGKYDLVHPNSESVYVAGQLMWLLGDDPEFQATLDDLYGATILLLDEVHEFVRHTSSLEDHADQWQAIEALAMSEFEAALKDQLVKLI